MAKAVATTKKKNFRKKEKKNIPLGIVHIAASFNNTMISITDTEGNLISQSSSGARGFRGSRKGTPFAAQQAASEAARKALEVGMREVQVRVKVRAEVESRQSGQLITLVFVLLQFVIQRQFRITAVVHRSAEEFESWC